MQANEFDHPVVARSYDVAEGSREDLDLYRGIATELSARDVLDVGCGTGVLAVLLTDDGCSVTGVDPAGAMLDVARAREGGDRVTWVHGDATTLLDRDPRPAFDLAVMAGNVAQVFTTDDAWLATLRAVHAVLRPGGHLVFETRDPARRAWETWAAAPPGDGIEVPGLGTVTDTLTLVAVDLPLVTFRHDNHLPDGSVVPAESTLIFRDREDLHRTLAEAGFTVEDVRDAPDRPGLEWVVIARRP